MFSFVGHQFYVGPSKNLRMLTLGMTKDIIYFPVQYGLGFSTAGIGRVLSEPIHIMRFITVCLSIKVSFLVNNIIPSRESCTIPITGLFD